MLLAIKLLGRWLTLETGRVGEENEPEVEVAATEEEKLELKRMTGFSLIDPYEVSVDE